MLAFAVLASCAQPTEIRPRAGLDRPERQRNDVSLLLELGPVGSESGSRAGEVTAHLTGRVTPRVEPMLTSRDSLGPKFDVVLTVDLSAGTSARFEITPTRWERIIRRFEGPPPIAGSVLEAELFAARALVARLDPRWTRIAVVTSAGSQDRSEADAITLTPLTEDHAAVGQALRNLATRVPAGDPNPAAALRAAERELLLHGGPDREPFIVMLMDAATFAPDATVSEAARTAAQALGEAGVRIHTIALVRSDPPASPGAGAEAASLAAYAAGQGLHAALREDLLAGIGALALADLDQLRIKNGAIGASAERIRFGADGGFDAAIPVVDGLNALEFSASGAFYAGSGQLVLEWPPGSPPEDPETPASVTP
jgi:hypothetical protein